MEHQAFLSEWDTLVLMVPFLVVLAIGMFGLDERIATRKHAAKGRRFFCEVGKNGCSFLSDPDGKQWKTGPNREIEGKWMRLPDPKAGIELGADPSADSIIY